MLAQWWSAVHRVMLFGGDVAKKARGGYSAIPNQTSTSMATSDTLRYASIPLVHGPGVIPAVGFGTLIHDPLVAKQATKAALEVGFRHLDCAERYRTEEAVGEAMQESFKAGTIRRHDVFVTTKLWNTNHRPERVKPAFDASRQRLQIDHVDCYMIHTPFAFLPGDDQDPTDEHGQVLYDSDVTLLETWQALERLVDEGQCRSIGLSDVTLKMLQEIFAAARIKPASVQVECHPYFPQWDLIDFCRERGIVVQAGAPLAHASSPRIVEDPVIKGIAERVHKTPAQVALAWAVQRGTAVLTSSSKPDRIRENFEISTLPEEAMREIRDNITTNIRFNPVVETGVPGFIRANENRADVAARLASPAAVATATEGGTRATTTGS
jgi:diketogulonate reductase-like aldo/keto reductase